MSDNRKGKKKSFQDRLDELSGLVEELESGELSLEDAIERFEAGRKLHAGLLAELDTYEKRIEKLIKGEDGEDRLEVVPPAGGRGAGDRDAPEVDGQE